ncbi:MAG TPA: hypothetical protein VFY48_03790 [Solirubrobacterales bacterium]|nr:hypothetical protein [Solirubrobacterales bacterium]
MRVPFVILLALVVLFAAGCGGRDDSTPVACLEGTQAYLDALEDAPGEVLLEGETPISECLAENQPGGDLATVGEAMVEAATELSAEAREQPGGAANLQLGYLIGAARRGAGETEGIHTDLVRRLVVAGRYAPGDQPLPPEFVRAYREGFAAGQAGG